MKDNSFLKQTDLLLSNHDSCRFNYKLCGKDGNRFCIDSKSSCPITYLSIGVNETNQQQSGGKNSSLIKSALISEGVYVNIAGYEYKQSLPISVFSVGMGSNVCLSDYNHQTTTRSKVYELYKGTFYNCQSSSDDRFTPVYSTSEFNLFSSNLDRNLAHKFPIKDQFNEVYSPSVKYYIQSRNYIHWETQNFYCMRLISEIEQKKQNYDRVSSYWLVQMIINIVCLIVTIGYCIMACKELDNDYGESNVILKIINYASKVIQLPFVVLALTQCGSVIGYF